MSMRVTLRLALSVVAVTVTTVFLFAGLLAWQEKMRLEEELARRAAVLTESIGESVILLMEKKDLAGLRHLAEQFGDHQQVAGIAVYGTDGQPLVITPRLLPEFQSMPVDLRQRAHNDRPEGSFLHDGGKRWHLQALPIREAGWMTGTLVLFHDASYIDAYGNRFWRESFLHRVLSVLLISLVALLIVVRWGLLKPLSRTVEWLKRVQAGDIQEEPIPPKGELFAPFAREVTHMAKSLATARAAAEEEARLRNAGESRWTPERLKEQVRATLEGRPLLVIANREPYMHVRRGRQIQCIVPASGLVTAVEPILRACGGTWIGHGSGDADRETADSQGRLKVPPEEPLYTLRRIWLSQEEEKGYYYGFSNEGLWPLCHIAHTRPLFRAEDWDSYAAVNAKFADAALEEIAQETQPWILIQDYHYALLPRLIKRKRPDAKVALFWHIPWPNPEAFGICPWARELLDGMLGADLVGFHTQFHCNNFLDTVDRMLESRIDWEQFAVNRGGHTTWVKPFPISIATQDTAPPAENHQPPAALREKLLKELGVNAERIGVGVDRIDYTKGIAERFRSIERFLEKYPAFVGTFTFLELAAPSRSLIKRYQDLETELEAEADRINRRFQTRGWKPILFIKKHHSHEEIAPVYRAADVCLVTSLHDGMNLVAKEFVAARGDNQGVLILSQFAGASREFSDALMVNPYDIEQVAEAIHYALTMDAQERTRRMSRMREVLQEHNVYRWAANLITELAKLRQASPEAESSLRVQTE